MKFYVCQTPNGPRYARTQAEAKAIDPAFQQVNLDTDQAALVNQFNSQFENGITFAQSTGIRINDNPATVDDVIALAREMDEEDGGYPEPSSKRKKPAEVTSATDWGYAPPAGSCERCVAMSAAAREIEGIMAATNIEYSLSHADEGLLKRVEEAVAERRRELANA